MLHTAITDLLLESGEPLEAALEAITKAHPRVYARVLQARGPGGGNPEVEWASMERNALEAFLRDVMGYDTVDLATMTDLLDA